MIGPKCVLCKKQRHLHNAARLACPIGKRHRVYGFTRFHPENRFEAKEPKPKPGSEARKDRKVRREVKSHPCCACGTRGTDWNPVDPAHIRTFKVTQSDHPANLIPLCRDCHRTQHSEGWAEFIRARPSVGYLLETMGWVFHLDPFNEQRVILVHPEIA